MTPRKQNGRCDVCGKALTLRVHDRCSKKRKARRKAAP